MDWKEAFAQCSIVVVDEDKYEKLLNTYMVGGTKVKMTQEAMNEWKPPMFQRVRTLWLRPSDPLFQLLKNRISLNRGVVNVRPVDRGRIPWPYKAKK